MIDVTFHINHYLNIYFISNNVSLTGFHGRKRPSLTECHMLIKSTKRRCAVCSRYHIQRRTTLECGKCRVALCSNEKRDCFQMYHLSMGIFLDA